jgi:hypothetical protein
MGGGGNFLVDSNTEERLQSPLIGTEGGGRGVTWRRDLRQKRGSGGSLLVL